MNFRASWQRVLVRLGLIPYTEHKTVRTVYKYDGKFIPCYNCGGTGAITIDTGKKNVLIRKGKLQNVPTSFRTTCSVCLGNGSLGRASGTEESLEFKRFKER